MSSGSSMRRTITNQTWEQMKTAYASGIGVREPARNAVVPERTVLSRAKRECWTQQIQSAKALVEREDALANPSEAASDDFAETRRTPPTANGRYIRARR